MAGLRRVHDGRDCKGVSMGITSCLPYLAAGLLGVQVAWQATRSSECLLRPPGAQDEADFLSRCVKCGRCIEACPYAVLKAARSGDGNATGTPVLNPREHACRLCEDLPCIEACPTEALRPLPSRENVRIGTAVIDEEACIAFQGMRCEVCYRTCPLIDRAITIDYRKRDGDAIHSVFAPTIDKDACTGCGLCVERCVVSEPEVPIRIVRNLDKGNVG